jgi:hypothetical protein
VRGVIPVRCQTLTAVAVDGILGATIRGQSGGSLLAARSTKGKGAMETHGSESWFVLGEGLLGETVGGRVGCGGR